MRPIRILLLVGLASPAIPALAVDTEVWVREGETLRAGTLEGMTLVPAGALVPGPAMTLLGRPETPVLWDAVIAGRDALAGSGETMGLWRLSEGSDPQRLPGLPPDPDVFAIARGGGGVVYVATGPEGAVFRLDPARGTFEEVARPPVSYIWDLVLLPGGDLALATGIPGRVMRLSPSSGQLTTIWETREPHVRRLALAPDGTLYAGTAGSGLLVRLDGKGGGFVVWDSERPEVSALAVDPGGTVWVAFAGAAGKADAGGTGERARRVEEGEAPATTVTVRARAVAEEEEGKPKPPAPAEKPGPPPMPSGGGELLRLPPGAAPQGVWSDGKETPLALLAQSDGSALLGTAGPARIWWFDPEGRSGWWAEMPEYGAVSALDSDGDRVLAAASNPAAVVLFGPGRAATARWTSDVLDARRGARFGRILAVTEGAPVTVLARSGNTSEPGPGWSDWIEVPGAAGPAGSAGTVAGVPDARFLQIRVEGTATSAASVSRIEARYRATNRPPRVESVGVLPQGVAIRALPPSAVASGDAPVVPPPFGPDARKAINEQGGSQRSKRAYESDALTLTWQAKDPDDDELVFRLDYCRDGGTPCEAWVTLDEELDQAFFSFDGRRLADGIYRFRVTASDARDNPAGVELEGSRISEAVRIDHVAPLIEKVEVTPVPGDRLSLRVVAKDPGGRLAGCEAATAPGEGRRIGAADGVVDGDVEVFEGIVDAPRAGGTLVVTVVDAAGNTTTRIVPGSGSSTR